MALRDVFKYINPGYYRGEIKKLEQQLGMWQRADRPSAGHLYSTDQLVPLYPFPPATVYQVCKYSDVLTGMHRALRAEIFRNGVEVVEAQDQDTENTDTEEEATQQRLTRTEILAKLGEVNKNAQSVIELLEQLEDDINIIDHAYMFLRFDYLIDAQGQIAKREFVEAIRLHPATMTPVKNNRDEFGKDDGGNDLMIAPSDRSQVYTNRTHHPRTGEALFPAWYKQNGEAGDYYFFKWEIVHATRYRPEGMSPVVTAWQKIRTLMYQDKYFLELYEGKRPPKGILAFFVANREAMKAAWEDMISRAKENPHLPGVIGIPPAATGGNGQTKVMEFVDFMKGMDELQFSEQRQEFKLALGFLYGVSPVLMNDTSTSGGLNNEGLQYTVTNRAVEAAQNMWNRKFLQAIRDAMGAEGWIVRLRPSEEQDEMAKIQRIAANLQNGKAAVDLGLQARYDKRLGEVIIEDGDIVPQMSNQMGTNGSPFGNPDPFNQPPGGGGAGWDPNPQPGPQSPEQSSGTPISPAPSGSPLAKGWVYVPEGKTAPEGARTKQGGKGATYYWAEGGQDKGPSRKELLQKDPDKMSEDEIQAAMDMMASEQVKYTEKDLAYAKAWLKKQPALRERYGKNYYEFAVEVASAINRGEDPEAIDWGSLDREISVKDAIMEQRYGDIEMSASVAKAAGKRAPFSGMADRLKGIIDKHFALHKVRPTKKQLEDALAKVQETLTPELKKAADQMVQAHYMRAKAQADRELGKNLGFGTVDQEAITTLQNQEVVYKAFAWLTKDMADGIREIIEKAYNTPGGLNMTAIQKEVKALADVSDFRAENIARTEMGKVSMAARINQYKKADPAGKFVYKWIGPDDHRTTGCSKRIKSRTEKGVPWTELVKIVKEESAKDFPKWTVRDDFPVSHYQSRHTFVKVGELA